MSPKSSEVLAAIVDLCAQVEAQTTGMRQELQMSFYEMCGGLNNHITREMDRMVYHVKRLIDQNGFLYDRVIELEKRDDPEKVSSGNRKLHNQKKGKDVLHSGGAPRLDEIRSGVARRRVHSPYRQAG